jgi:hypothetical protein
MKKIRSLNQLNEEIDKDLATRKRALTTLKLSLENIKDSSKRPLSLSAVCMLYAHWEGFVKFAGTCYVNYVHHKGVPLKQISDSLAGVYLRSHIRGLKSSKKVSLNRELISQLRSESEAPLTLPLKAAIETYDNLNSDVLYEILCIIGCDTSWYDTKRVQIDEKLLRHRNSIAHTGDDIEFDEAEYNKLHTGILQIIEQFRDDVQNAASQKKYLA